MKFSFFIRERVWYGFGLLLVSVAALPVAIFFKWYVVYKDVSILKLCFRLKSEFVARRRRANGIKTYGSEYDTNPTDDTISWIIETLTVLIWSLVAVSYFFRVDVIQMTKAILGI